MTKELKEQGELVEKLRKQCSSIADTLFVDFEYKEIEDVLKSPNAILKYRVDSTDFCAFINSVETFYTGIHYRAVIDVDKIFYDQFKKYNTSGYSYFPVKMTTVITSPNTNFSTEIELIQLGDVVTTWDELRPAPSLEDIIKPDIESKPTKNQRVTVTTNTLETTPPTYSVENLSIHALKEIIREVVAEELSKHSFKDYSQPIRWYDPPQYPWDQRTVYCSDTSVNENSETVFAEKVIGKELRDKYLGGIHG